MKISLALFLTLLSSTNLLWAPVHADCPAIPVQDNFDLDAYVSAPWYVQQQAVVSYLPEEDFFCVQAQYEEVQDRGWFGRIRTYTWPWRYTVRVNNQAQDVTGASSGGGGLCAYQTDPHTAPAKLAVAPCFLPKVFAGDYWVVAYNETEGYALVSGGQPTRQTANGCQTGDGILNSGLWIFTRQQARDAALVQQVRDLASGLGFDLDVLLDVDQSNCGTRRRSLNEVDSEETLFTDEPLAFLRGGRTKLIYEF